MLSGETAVGEYPVESVEMMNRIMVETEKTFQAIPARVLPSIAPPKNLMSGVLSNNAADIAEQIDAKLVVIASSTDATALRKSKHRDFHPTVCITDSLHAARQMSLFWGIVPIVSSATISAEQIRNLSEHFATRFFNLKKGDQVVIVSDTELIPGVHDSIVITKIS